MKKVLRLGVYIRRLGSYVSLITGRKVVVYLDANGYFFLKSKSRINITEPDFKKEWCIADKNLHIIKLTDFQNEFIQRGTEALLREGKIEEMEFNYFSKKIDTCKCIFVTKLSDLDKFLLCKAFYYSDLILSSENELSRITELTRIKSIKSLSNKLKKHGLEVVFRT